MKYFPFALLLAPFSLCAQTADSLADADTINYRKDFIRIYYSADHEYRNVFTDHGLLETHQAAPLSWTIGLGWAGDFTKHLSATAGLELSFKLVETDTISVNDPVERTVWYKDEISLLTIPMEIEYLFGNRLRFGFMAGTAFKYKILEGGYSFRWHRDGSGTSEPQPGNKNFPFGESFRYNQDVRAGLIAEYNFKRSRLRLMPVYRFDLFRTYRGMDCPKAMNYGLSIEYNFR